MKTMSFESAVEIANEHKYNPNVGLSQKLSLYAYYKVATSKNLPFLNSYTAKDIAKYHKWKDYKAKYSKTEAEKRYVALVTLLYNEQNTQKNAT